MKEILFRGKRTDNGEWVYGYPLIDTAPCSLKANGQCVCAHDGSNAVIFYWNDDFHEYESVEVIPETIGQYTGLMDKNGKKIFEGDILKICIPIYQCKPMEAISEVYFDSCCFRVRWGGSGLDDFACGTTFEVVGNIHDNKELLEESDHGTE